MKFEELVKSRSNSGVTLVFFLIEFGEKVDIARKSGRNGRIISVALNWQHVGNGTAISLILDIASELVNLQIKYILTDGER